jgi:hypothetical protein
MSEWGRHTYGNPCHECGFDWDTAPDDAMASVSEVSDTYRWLLRGTDGTQRHPQLAWTAGAYVCHVTDNLRVWAERLAGAAAGALDPIVAYDSDLLARARHYEHIPLVGALWSLHHAARVWREAVELAADADVRLVHPDRGEQTVRDVILNNAHDAHHHCWDIARSSRPTTGSA